MASITAMLSYLEQLENPYIAIHRERCILVRNRNASCLRCADACTSDCITYEDEQLTITAQNCVGCGTCATVCPTCALETIRQCDEALTGACSALAERDEGRVVIACGSLLDLAAGKYDPCALVRVECLGRVEETLLCELAAEGVEEVVLVHGACDTCVHRCGWETLQDVLATQKTLLETWNCPLAVQVTSKLPGRTRMTVADYDASKRESLLAGGQSVMHVGALAAEASLANTLGVSGGAAEVQKPSLKALFRVMEDGTLPHFIPDRRERLLDALALLGEPEDTMINTRLWGHVIIDVDKCRSCQLCATFCPTGALRKFQDEDGTFGVEHYPGDCVKCRCCEAICPEQVIEISDEVFAREMLMGMTDRYEMKPVAVERGGAHSIHNSMKVFMKTPLVFER